jgi:hypothetical protein
MVDLTGGGCTPPCPNPLKPVGRVDREPDREKEHVSYRILGGHNGGASAPGVSIFSVLIDFQKQT